MGLGLGVVFTFALENNNNNKNNDNYKNPHLNFSKGTYFLTFVRILLINNQVRYYQRHLRDDLKYKQIPFQTTGKWSRIENIWRNSHPDYIGAERGDWPALGVNSFCLAYDGDCVGERGL